MQTNEFMKQTTDVYGRHLNVKYVSLGSIFRQFILSRSSVNYSHYLWPLCMSLCGVGICVLVSQKCFEKIPTVWIIVLTIICIIVSCVYSVLTDITEESIQVIDGFGIQLNSKVKFGRDNKIFFDFNSIKGVIINEAVTMQRVVFYLAIVTKEEKSDKEGKTCGIGQGTRLVTVFKRLANGMAEPSVVNCENVDKLKSNFDAILSKLYSLGLSIHLLKDKSVVFPTEARELEVLDGDEAMKHFNQPQYSNKVLAFGSRHFYCHSEYLRLRSEYFDALFAGDYQESSMDLINIELPAPTASIELLLRYLYLGKANEKLFYGVEIFKTIENSNYLGVHELISLAVEAFTVRWKSLVPSSLFRRSVVDLRFVRAFLSYGSKKGAFQDGDKLKVVVLWSSKADSDLREAQSLLLEHKCLENASLADLQWSMETNSALLTGLEFSNFRSICQRARRENDELKALSKSSAEKAKGLLECVRILTKQLEEVRCSRCYMYMPRVAMKTRTCVTAEHAGDYTMHKGWSCCKQIKKRSKGCKPVGVTRHACTRSSSSSSSSSSNGS